ncbi:MAG: flavin monoamine oxidase family protein [Chloroflexota bacterium]
MGDLRNVLLNRRALLAGAAAAGLTRMPMHRALAQADLEVPTYAVSPQRVLVLGAGMAGLTAALALHRRGHDVTVIEYQNRVGGRLLSLPLADGQFSEAGGGHFRATMGRLLDYVLHYDLPLVSMNDGLPRYTIDGMVGDAANPAAWKWDLHPDERNLSIASMLSHYLMLNGIDHTAVIDPVWPDQATLERLDPLTLRELIIGAGGSEAFLKLLGAHGGLFTPDASALTIQGDIAYHFGEQALFRIEGGNERLPQAMAEDLSGRIVLDAPVTMIDQSGPDVRVVTQGGREFTGDVIVSTIPFSVIQEIEVQPAWSAGKQRMFESMEWSTTVKMVVQTKTPQWLSEGVHGWPMAGGDRTWERLIDITGNEPGGHGNAFFYMNGSNSAAYRAMPAATREQELIAMCEADMPGLLGEVIHTETFDWVEQPWIKGSFGDLPLNGGWMIGEWTRPEDRIHFAGDFTSLKTGWVEGAIESGLRAARQIDPLAPAEEPIIRVTPTS